MAARRDLGHTELVTLKVHPDLMTHLQWQADRHYCSEAEFIRQLIVADKAVHPTPSAPPERG